MEKYKLVVLPGDITLLNTHISYTYLKSANENKIDVIPGHFHIGTKDSNAEYQ